jgi:hypothetical protein
MSDPNRARSLGYLHAQHGVEAYEPEAQWTMEERSAYFTAFTHAVESEARRKAWSWVDTVVVVSFYFGAMTLVIWGVSEWVRR